MKPVNYKPEMKPVNFKPDTFIELDNPSNKKDF